MASISDHADQNICKIMVGNKIDLKDERKISKKEAEELAAKYQMKYYEVSAKQNIGLSECLETLFGQVYRKRFDIPSREPSFGLKDQQ